MTVRQPPLATASRGSAAARLARAIALFLLLMQALVVPAHRHPSDATPSARPIVAAGTTLATPAKQRPDHPADCPVCREVAHAGHYLTPGDVALPVASATVLAPAAATLASREADTHSHSWRSRAPPVFGLS